jgi:PadR family transcriptional regulator PadR
MDAQFRRGILDACVLAVLEQGESYGYQMVKDINEFIEISESTLYPILKRLENAQMLTVFKQEHNGRLRKYYRITDAGRDHITELMNEWEEVVRVFQYISREREQCHEKGSVS